MEEKRRAADSLMTLTNGIRFSIISGVSIVDQCLVKREKMEKILVALD